MSSASLLGGARGSLGRAGHSSIHSFLGQGSCNLVIDRENERASWNNHGAVESSEGGVSCTFAAYPSTSYSSASKGARCGLYHDSAPSPAGFARYSCVTRSGLLISPVASRGPTGPSVNDSCPSTSASSVLVYPTTLCRGLESTTARALGFPNVAGRFAPSLKVCRNSGSTRRKGTRADDGSSASRQRGSTRSMAASPDEGDKAMSSPDFRETADMQMIKEWNSNQYLRNSDSETAESWEQLNMIIRVVYAMAMYGALGVAANALCNFTGVDCWGGFQFSIETFVQALGWAIPPMMALLLILEDEIVKVCPPARAIRDVEDEELMDFFVGMNAWQFIFVVAAGALSEELFFRVAIQGGLAHALQYTAKGPDESVIGLSALTTIIPFFTPFAQAFAAVLTASLTGSMYYVISSPKDPTYVIAPVSGGKYGWNNRRDIKKRIEAWYERRQLRKIYSPLMEAILALYLGFEWVQTGNIFGPIVTHTLYSLVVAGNGLRKIHDNRLKLRQRVSQVTRQKELASDAASLDKLN